MDPNACAAAAEKRAGRGPQGFTGTGERAECFEKGPDRDRLLVGLADAFDYVGDTAEARRLWHKIADDKPDDLQVWFALFEAALQANDINEAEAICKDKMQRIEGSEAPFPLMRKGRWILRRRKKAIRPI